MEIQSLESNTNQCQENQQNKNQNNNLSYDFIWDKIQHLKNYEKQDIKEFKQYFDNEEVNSALGCMFGAFMGDALGSNCQFQRFIPKEDLQYIMSMPGNGTFIIKSGQFTDDSELASHLLQGLSNFDFNKSIQSQKDFVLLKIAQQYVNWVKSGPFDIGNTTRKAFRIIKMHTYDMKVRKQDGQSLDESKSLDKMLQQIKEVNISSQSNGSLMRITPMAFFISLILQKKQNVNLKCKDFQKFIKSQINMTHGDEEIYQAGYSWVQLLVELILRKRNKRSLKQIFEDFISKYQNDEFTKKWINLAKKQQYLVANVNQGWAAIAWTFGIKKMKSLLSKNQEQLNENDYIQIIRDVIGRAGDTDTNGAIVGGLIGAILGFKKLPIKYLHKQFNLQLNQNDPQCSNRGIFYEPKRQFYNALKLVQKYRDSQE